MIENQFGRSDHDHLGKLVTYVAALDAKAAVWIVADPRPEHVGAINWLNEGGSAAFCLLRIEAVRMGDSAPAPLLTRITGPSEEAIEVGKAKKDVVERHVERERFWAALLARAKPAAAPVRHHLSGPAELDQRAQRHLRNPSTS